MSSYDVKARLGVNLGNWVTAFNRAKRASSDFYRSIKRQDFSSIKNQGRVIQDFGRRATATFGSVALASAAGMGKMIKTSASYESAFAGVRKTTEMTDKGYRKLDKTFRQMSRTMPATYEEIAAVGEIAGQLGVEEKNLASFTKTMIMMGTATNMSSEEAATSIARFANIMDMPLSKAENLGSTIVELGNNSATTEAEIVELGLRIAASGRMADMSEADVMALSTSMSSLGIEAEAGGTAMSMTLNKMNSDLSEGGEAAKQWADVAGMSVSEFQRAFEEDAYGATVLFLEGLRDIDESGGDVNAVLKEMGINGIRQQDVIKRLMYSTEDMTNYQKMANDEFKNSSALVEEAGERYKTFDSQVIMAWNSIRNISATLGTTFKNALAGLMNGIMPVIHAIEDFTDGLIDAEGNLTPLGQIIGKVGVAFVGFMTILTGLMAVVWVVGGTIAAFGAIMESALGAALLTTLGPIGLVIGAVALLGTTFWIFKDQIMGALSTAWGYVSEFASNVGISFTGIGESVSDLTSKAGELSNSFKDTAVDAFTSGMERLSGVLDILTVPFEKVSELGIGVGDALRMASGPAVSLGVAMLGLTGPIGMVIGLLTFLATKTNIVTDMISVFKGEMEFEEAIQNMAEMVTSFIEGFSEMLLAAVETGSQIIISLVEGIAEGLPLFLETAMLIMTTLIEQITETLPLLIETGTLIIMTIIESILEMLPMLMEVAVMLIETIVLTITEMIPVLMEVGMTIVITIIESILEMLPMLMEVAIMLIETIVTTISEMLPMLMEAGLQIVTTLVTSIIEMLPALIELGIQLLMSLIEGIIQLLPTLAETAITIITTLLTQLLTSLPMLLSAGIDMLLAIVDGLIQMIPAIISAAIDIVLALIQAIISNLPQIISAGMDIVSALIRGIIQILPQLISAGIKLVFELAKAIISKLPDILSAGKDLLLALIEGLLSLVGQLISTGWDLIIKLAGAIADKFPDILEKGKELVGKVIDGIKSKFSEMMNSGKELVGKKIDGIKSKFSEMLEKGKELVGKVIDGVKNKFSEIKSKGEELVGKMKDGVKGKISDMIDVGKDIVNGMIDGISNMKDKAIETITGVVNGVVDKAKSLLSIKSPSRVFMGFGEYVSEGLAIGIDNMAKMAVKSSGNLAKEVTTAFNPDLSLQTTDIDAQLRSFNREARAEMTSNLDNNVTVDKQPVVINIYDNKEAVRAYVNKHNAIDARIRRF